MFPKIVVPPNHPILIGVSIIFTIHFGGTTIFGNTQMNSTNSFDLLVLSVAGGQAFAPEKSRAVPGERKKLRKYLVAYLVP